VLRLTCRFPWRDRGQDNLEQCSQELADLYISIDSEMDEIRALLHRGKKVEAAPGPLVLPTIEERLTMLVRSQQVLARDVSDLKAILGELPGTIG
jgi:hypothetical protein